MITFSTSADGTGLSIVVDTQLGADGSFVVVADPKSRAAAITWCESVLDPSDILPILLDLESLFICESVVLIDLGRFFAPEISKNWMSIYTFVGRFYNYLDSLIDSLDISLLCRTNSVNCNFN